MYCLKFNNYIPSLSAENTALLKLLSTVGQQQNWINVDCFFQIAAFMSCRVTPEVSAEDIAIPLLQWVVNWSVSTPESAKKFLIQWDINCEDTGWRGFLVQWVGMYILRSSNHWFSAHTLGGGHWAICIKEYFSWGTRTTCFGQWRDDKRYPTVSVWHVF